MNDEGMLIVRIGIGVIMLAASLEAWRMSAILHNDRLFILGKRIFYALFVFGLLRVVASIVDGWVDLGFAWFATSTTYAFWFATYWFFASHRRVLQKEATASDLEEISQSFDTILEKMKLVKKRVDESINNSESPNTV
jgi:hypothetical protein